MKLEKWSWIAGIVAAIVAMLALVPTESSDAGSRMIAMKNSAPLPLIARAPFA